MARRKNVKRIDPRYFLNETVLKEEFVEKTPEERAAEIKAAKAARAAPYKGKAAQYEKEKATAEKQPQKPKAGELSLEDACRESMTDDEGVLNDDAYRNCIKGGQTGGTTGEGKRSTAQHQVNDAFDQLRRLVKTKPEPGSPGHERMKKFAKIIQTAQVQYPDLVDKQQLQWLADAGVSLDVETTQKKIAAGGEAIPSEEKPLHRRAANKLYMKGVRALGKSKWHEIPYKHPLRVAWKKTRKNPKKYSAELRRAVAQAASGEGA